ncbi:hypothetical protein AMAG_20227 [Allomyces macrogynus ATCC 38327]|uniref:Uncharacterized protein n=1 Tax=Allomyces macrogynus (strain ATCC 38327) TaxID=578462 RepID=A0A0L0T5W0_ALLM3|nr:hypothetical protein AMAG_20227 [Allomyces macrogynus ATCC 38327]|eukprot:KNE70066.1 hypothetical protein AMAG_20227 [Allomyces macrogynus ATCC 38327]
MRAASRVATRLVAAAAAQGIHATPIETVDGGPPRIMRIINQSPADVEVLVSRTQKSSGSDVTIRAPLPADLIAPETFTVPISARVTPSTDPNDPDEWMHIIPGYKVSWKRSTPQVVRVKAAYGVRDAVLAKPGSKINFVGPDPLVLAPIAADKSSIVATNDMAVILEVQATSRPATRAGNWFVLAPGSCNGRF